MFKTIFFLIFTCIFWRQYMCIKLTRRVLRKVEMASRDKAQHFVECDLCRQPVSFFCRRCRINLCDPCVPIHLRVRSVIYHDIAIFAIKDDDETCFCDSHFLNDCSAYCKTCKIPICSVCVSAKHKSHKIYELSYKIKKNF